VIFGIDLSCWRILAFHCPVSLSRIAADLALSMPAKSRLGRFKIAFSAPFGVVRRDGVILLNDFDGNVIADNTTLNLKGTLNRITIITLACVIVLVLITFRTCFQRKEKVIFASSGNTSKSSK